MASYVAPKYPKGGTIEGPVLLKKIEEFSPAVIVLGIAGGKQEVLGEYLRRNLKVHTTILCTGVRCLS